MTVELDPAVTRPAPPRAEGGVLAETASFGFIALMALLGLALLPGELPAPSGDGDVGDATLAAAGPPPEGHVPSAALPLWALPRLEDASPPPEPVPGRPGAGGAREDAPAWRKVSLVTRNLLFRPRVRLASGSLHLVTHEGQCLVDGAVRVGNTKGVPVDVEVTVTSDATPAVPLGVVRGTAPAGGDVRLTLSAALPGACPSGDQAVASLQEVRPIR